MNNKGVSMTVVSMIVLAISFAVVLLIAEGFFNTVEANTIREKCKNTLAIATKTDFFGKEAFVPWTCETKLVFIDTADKEEAMGLIAEELYWCWWQFDVFERDDPLGQWGAYLANVNCNVCSYILLGEETKKIDSITGEDLVDYMRNTPIPEGDGETYMDSFEVEETFDILGNYAFPFEKYDDPDIKMDLTQDHVVHFAYVKESAWAGLFRTAIQVTPPFSFAYEMGLLFGNSYPPPKYIVNINAVDKYPADKCDRAI